MDITPKRIALNYDLKVTFGFIVKSQDKAKINYRSSISKAHILQEQKKAFLQI